MSNHYEDDEVLPPVYQDTIMPASAMLTTRKGVLLDAKRAFSGGALMLTVYAFTFKDAERVHTRAARCALLRIHLPKNTPKDEWRQTLRNMVMLVVQAKGIETYTLRSKI